MSHCGFFICIFLIAVDVEYLFMFLLAIYVSSLDPFRSLAHFKIGLLFYLFICKGSLYILDVSSLWDIQACNLQLFSRILHVVVCIIVDCMFTFLMVSISFALTFRSTNYFELILISSIRKGSNFILLHMDIQLFHHVWLFNICIAILQTVKRIFFFYQWMKTLVF